MRSFQSIVNGIIILAVGIVAHPLDSPDEFQSLVRRVESPDNTCGMTGAGNNLGYTCGTTTDGPCCSQNGWCGSTADYCGTGCQKAYGTCNATQGATDDGTCGPANGNKKCSAGKCCSPAGFCGTTEEYCQSPDCLRGFGTCDADQTPTGATTAGTPRLLFGNVPFGADIYDCVVPKTIALTFDDGPFTYTNELLDVLAAHKAKATFFVTGVNLGKGRIDDPTLPWAAMIKRMNTDGHQIASHSWSHADLSTLTESDRRDEMIKNEMALRNIIGKWPTYMRPPYSSCDAACMATMTALGYHVIYFDLDTEDYLHATPATNYISQQIVHNALATTEDNWLSIMHDIHEQTVHNLTSYFLNEITKKGFRTVTVGECLGDPAANWYRTMNETEVSTTTTTTLPVTSSTTSTIVTNSTTTTTLAPPLNTTIPDTTTPTTTKTTTTTTPTVKPPTPTPTPISTCSTTKINTWCAQPITPFTNHTECLSSVNLCNTDAGKCTTVAGLQYFIKCEQYKKHKCKSLQRFCKSAKCSAAQAAQGHCTREKWEGKDVNSK